MIDEQWCGIEHTELVNEPTLKRSIRARREGQAGKNPEKPEAYFLWMHSRAEQYRHWAFAARQRATEARFPQIKAAYEDVASGWFALAAQLDWLELEPTTPDETMTRNKAASVPMYRPELLLLY